MTSVLGVDPSLTKTGLGFLTDHHHQPDRIRCLSFSVTTREHPVDAWCREMCAVIDTLRPDLVVFERALDIVVAYAPAEKRAGGAVVNSGQLLLNRLDGALRGICVARAIRHEGVLPKTWRAWALGNGNLTRQEAKAAARRRCALIGIRIGNIDEAEAALVCLYGTTIAVTQNILEGG